ncbi:hypothetical protein [Nostoc sp. ChiQUE01b]|uniref:hypothetical protein n=1 Tax=Nostoc sp. ChiQUE01b TaxID=3075376 RepID=UPI002AD226F8|nr:hypothetical protein [Nostoc sp. ChiQUE01b]MDZ8241835.1 hypothetical protein [Nostoc sp. ChiQUE01a]MDZ8264605.1 hypothetical protein [Nostoc sp. ChiQUE01b]
MAPLQLHKLYPWHFQHHCSNRASLATPDPLRHLKRFEEAAIALNECHAISNAIAVEGKLGMVKASMQGIVALNKQPFYPTPNLLSRLKV